MREYLRRLILHSLVTLPILRTRPVFAVALKTIELLNRYVQSPRAGLKKDLFRVDLDACPGCKSRHLRKFGTVPYYETIVEKYGASLSALYQIVGPQHRFARFDLYYCMACELVFVPSSYQGFVEAARENPAFLRHVAAQYLGAAHPKVDEPFLREILKAGAGDAA